MPFPMFDRGVITDYCFKKIATFLTSALTTHYAVNPSLKNLTLEMEELGNPEITHPKFIIWATQNCCQKLAMASLQHD